MDFDHILGYIGHQPGYWFRSAAGQVVLENEIDQLIQKLLEDPLQDEQWIGEQMLLRLMSEAIQNAA